MLIAAAAAMTSCEKDNYTPDFEPQAVQLKTSVIAQTKVTLPDDERASLFELGDKIGVYMMKSSDKTITYPNALHTSNGTNFAMEGETLMFKSYENYDFAAYHPHTEGAPADLNDHTFAVLEQQHTKDNYNASDLMYASAAAIKPMVGAATVVPLVFEHKLSQVHVILRNAGSAPFVGPQPSISMIDAPTAVKLNVGTGAVAIQPDVANVQFLPITEYQEGISLELHYIGVIPAHKIALGKNVFVLTSGGIDYDISMKKALDMKTGFQHKFNVQIQGIDFKLDGGQILPWGEGIKISHSIEHNLGRAAKMTLDLTGANITNLADVTSAVLTINGLEFIAAKISNTANTTLALSYSQAGKWGMNLTKIVLRNSATSTLHTYDGAWDIIGNPTRPDYNETITVIEVEPTDPIDPAKTTPNKL